jgi:hypothetical protein
MSHVGSEAAPQIRSGRRSAAQRGHGGLSDASLVCAPRRFRSVSQKHISFILFPICKEEIAYFT